MSLEREIKSVLTIHFQNKVVSTIDIEHNSNKKKYTFGRLSDNDIVLNSPIISGHHAVFEVDDSECIVRDLNSTNGLYLNGVKVESGVLKNGDNLRIDDPANPHQEGILIVYSQLDDNSDERWNEYVLTDKDVVRIGRDKTNEISIHHSMISRNHAKLSRTSNGFTVEDLGSTNGTYVNGQLVTSKYTLKPFDVLIIGNTKLIYQGEKLVYNVVSSGLRLDAIQISKDVTDSSSGMFGEKQLKRLLDDISISIKSGELVALIGGSGAGKSTFMDSLNGFRLPSEGNVLINGDDFYANYNAYKNIIGYVPQADIVYDTLTVEEMLTYAAKLRMPEDTTPDELCERVAQVIKDVELESRENVLIKQLSGGQRKRASIAVELLADPKLFFLDEPTSGLDPGMERNMMQLLRKLANQGKTIILITHATANINLCDKAVILGNGGKLCYFGPPGGALEFFKVEEYADIYELIGKESAKWQNTFRQSKYFAYNKTLVQKEAKVKAGNSQAVSRSSLKQLAILTKRNLKLTLTDKQRFFFLIMQAPLIAILLGLVANKNAFSYYESTKEVIFPLACSAVWIGLLNSIQEVCKERPIYKRERAVNLQLVPYIMSKLIILGVMAMIQTALLVAVFSLIVKLPNLQLIGSIQLELMITIFLTTFASTAMGLTVSTLVTNTDRAMGLAPILLVPQLLFTGLVFKLQGASEVISMAAVSKWASRALGVSFDLNARPLELAVKYPKLPLPEREIFTYFEHTPALLYQNWGILGVFILICTLLALVFLKRQDDQL